MSLPHAILASLEMKPMTGYDLKKFFDQSAGHFWTATQSHIYKALTTLEKEGWVDNQVIVQESKPNRKEYSITESGKEELHRWLTTPLPPAPVREAWLIQLFFSHNSSKEEILHLLTDRGQKIRAVLTLFDRKPDDSQQAQVPAALKRASFFWQLTLEYGKSFYLFELEQNQKMIEQVRNLPDEF